MTQALKPDQLAARARNIRKSDIEKAAAVALASGVAVEIESNGLKYKVTPMDAALAKTPDFRL